MPAELTVTPIDPEAAGENPDGTLVEIVVEPFAAGWNCVVAVADPVTIDTGETVIVPTAVFPLVTLTLTGFWGDTACAPRKLPPASSVPVVSLRVVAEAPGVVEKAVPAPNGPEISTPEGTSVIVPLAVPKPLNVAV